MLKVGLIGAGAIAGINCTQINGHPDAKVTAVADPSGQRAAELSKEYGIGEKYDSIDDLLARSDVDAVAISVPNFLHAQCAIKALEAGRHVLLDKPFAMNSGEASRIADAASKSKKVFTLGMNHRFTPETRAMRSMVKAGRFGEIYYVSAYWRRRCGSPKHGTWFCRKDLAGGGAMLDIGVHALDMCLYIIDNFEPVSVMGAVYTKFGNRGLGQGDWGMSEVGEKVFNVDDFATAMIRMKNGVTVRIEASWVMNQKEASVRDVEIYGTEASAGAFPMKIYQMAGSADYNTTVELRPVGENAPNRFTNWIDAILNREKLACTIEQALAVQKILDAIYESSDRGHSVAI